MGRIRIRKMMPFGGQGVAGGWNKTAATMNQTSVQQNVTAMADSPDFYYYGGNNGGATTNNFRFASKSAPTIWTNTVAPYTITSVGSIVVDRSNTDKIYVGFSQTDDARMYLYTKSTNTFTNLNFPDRLDHSAVRSCCQDPINPDITYWGLQGDNAVGGMRLYKFVLSTTTWTLLFDFGSPASGSVNYIGFHGTEMWVTLAGGLVNINRVMKSTNATYTGFTQKAGDGVNGSWATGTQRASRLAFGGNNNLNTNNSNTIYAFIGGASAGDAECWRSLDYGNSWTQIGGDGLNGSWAAGTKTSAAGGCCLANIVVTETAGGAGDAEIWQFDANKPLASAWTKIGGDSVNGTWATRNTFGAGPYITKYAPANELMVGCGNNSVNTSELYKYPQSSFSPGSVQGSGYNTRAIRVS